MPRSGRSQAHAAFPHVERPLVPAASGSARARTVECHSGYPSVTKTGPRATRTGRYGPEAWDLHLPGALCGLRGEHERALMPEPRATPPLDARERGRAGCDLIEQPVLHAQRSSGSLTLGTVRQRVTQPFEPAGLPGCWRWSGDRLRLYPLALLCRRHDAMRVSLATQIGDTSPRTSAASISAGSPSRMRCAIAARPVRSRVSASWAAAIGQAAVMAAPPGPRSWTAVASDATPAPHTGAAGPAAGRSCRRSSHQRRAPTRTARRASSVVVARTISATQARSSVQAVFVPAVPASDLMAGTPQTRAVAGCPRCPRLSPPLLMMPAEIRRRVGAGCPQGVNLPKATFSVGTPGTAGTGSSNPHGCWGLPSPERRSSPPLAGFTGAERGQAVGTAPAASPVRRPASRLLSRKEAAGDAIEAGLADAGHTNGAG